MGLRHSVCQHLVHEWVVSHLNKSCLKKCAQMQSFFGHVICRARFSVFIRRYLPKKIYIYIYIAHSYVRHDSLTCDITHTQRFKVSFPAYRALSSEYRALSLEYRALLSHLERLWRCCVKVLSHNPVYTALLSSHRVRFRYKGLFGHNIGLFR